MDGKVRYWDIRPRGPTRAHGVLVGVYSGNTGPITSLEPLANPVLEYGAYVPYGRFISTSADGTVAAGVVPTEKMSDSLSIKH